MEQDTKQVIEDYIKDDKNKIDAIKLANIIFDQVGKNWITIDQVMKKLGFHKQQTESALFTLKLFNLVHEKEVHNSFKYKITLTVQQKIFCLQEDIIFYKQKIEIIEKNIKFLSN